METRRAKDDKTVAISGALLVVVVVYAAAVGALALMERWFSVSDGVRATVSIGALVLALVLAIAHLVRSAARGTHRR